MLSMPDITPITSRGRKDVQRRAMSGLDPTEHQAMALAADQPRLQQNSETLANAGGVLASAMVPFGPVIKAIQMAPRAAAGGAAAYGLIGGSPGADTNEAADLRELRKTLKEQGSPELQRLYKDLDAARGRQKTLDAEAGKAMPGSQARSAAAGRTALANDISEMERAIAAERTRVETEANERADSVMTARTVAATERDKERSKAPPSFNEYYSGLQKELPLLPPAWTLPMAGGAAAVTLGKAMSLPSAIFGRAKASNALRSGDYAAAETLAAAHAPGGASHFLKDAGLGAAGGFSLGSLPLAADLISQPQSNPEKSAQKAYLNELLPIDPRIEQARSRVESLPDSNPALDKAKDGWSWARGMAGGAVEGAFGGKMAGLAVDALKPKFTNALAEASRQRAAAAAAKNNGLNPPPPPPPPPPPQPVSYSKYPGAGDPAREGLRDVYRDAVLNSGSLPSPNAFNRATQQSFLNQGGSFPNITSRVKETNAAVERFVQQHGRLPISKQEWEKWIFRASGTLAVPLAVGVGAQNGEPSAEMIGQQLLQQ